MAKRKPSKRAKRITTKAVQDVENTPVATLPQVEAKPEVDNDPWDADALTLKQRRFCEFYVSTAAGNATRAAQMAGYRDDNRHALEVTAQENLRKPALRAFIGRLLASQGVGIDYLKSRLAQLAMSSMESVTTIDANGELVIDMAQAAKIGALAQVKELNDETLKSGGSSVLVKRKVKVHDPTRAIEMLLKMHGVAIDRVEHTGAGGGPIEQTVTHAFDVDRFSDLYRRRTGRNPASADAAEANGN